MNMDVQLMKKLDRQGLLFALVHTIVLLNVAVDFIFLS